MRHSHAHGDGLGRDRNGTLGNLGIETCSIPTACPVEHGPAKTLFVKGKSFPSLYDTIRDDPGALHKVDREGAALILVKESTKPGAVPADHVESTGGTPIALSFPSSAVSRIQSVSNPIGGLRQSESGHPNPPRTKGA